MRKTVLVLLTVVMVASACASNDTAELDVDVDTPPLQLVHVDEGPTPTTTFTDPVVGPGGPQERGDTSSPPPVTYPSTGPSATYPSTSPDGARTHGPTTASEPVEEPAAPAGDTTSTTVSVRLEIAQNMTCGAGLVKPRRVRHRNRQRLPGCELLQHWTQHLDR